MSREILLLVDALSREKNVDKEVVFESLESALASATKKRFADESDVRVEIDRDTGEYESFRRWEVVDDETFETPDLHIKLEEAQKRNPDIQIGDFVEEPLESIDSRGSSTKSPICMSGLRFCASSSLICRSGVSKVSSSTTSQRRNDSYSPVSRSISTRTSDSSAKRFFVAEASADSSDSNTTSLSTFFSRDNASTNSKISRLIQYLRLISRSTQN